MADDYHPSRLTIEGLRNDTYNGAPHAKQNNLDHIEACAQCKPIYDAAPTAPPTKERKRRFGLF